MEANEQHEPTDDTYCERVVAFVDILGFQELVTESHNDEGEREALIKALKAVKLASTPFGVGTGLKSQNFSDSVILSARPDAAGLWHLLLALQTLADRLLQIGVMVRGGVVLGFIYHDAEIVFGPSVVQAYRLESVIAKVPRIIVGSGVMRLAEEVAETSEVFRQLKTHNLLRDRDGVWFLHYLREYSRFNREGATHLQVPFEDFLAQGRLVAETIQMKIDTTVEAPNIYEKVQWLARYWNEEVAVDTNGFGQPWLWPIKLAGEKPKKLRRVNLPPPPNALF